MKYIREINYTTAKPPLTRRANAACPPSHLKSEKCSMFIVSFIVNFFFKFITYRLYHALWTNNIYSCFRFPEPPRVNSLFLKLFLLHKSIKKKNPSPQNSITPKEHFLLYKRFPGRTFLTT